MELGRLLQLVLGVAINCERKQEHIQRIMGMGEMQQQTIKYAIQEVSAIWLTSSTIQVFSDKTTP